MRLEAPAQGTAKLDRIAGWNAVAALFECAPERVERLFFEDRLKIEIGSWCEALARRRAPYRLVEAVELERIAGTAMHGGIVAVARPRALPSLDLDAVAGRPLLILDGVGNPHNLGAIARTAAFLGVRHLVLADHPSQAAPSDAAYRVAEGALERLDLWHLHDVPGTLERIARSHRVVGSALGGTMAPGQIPRDRPIALVLGNEESGLGRATLAACETIVTIPGGAGVQSLNVAAAAAILIYALLAG